MAARNENKGVARGTTSLRGADYENPIKSSEFGLPGNFVIPRIPIRWSPLTRRKELRRARTYLMGVVACQVSTVSYTLEQKRGSNVIVPYIRKYFGTNLGLPKE